MAIVTGANNHEAISAAIRPAQDRGSVNIWVIQQRAKPVFSFEGRPFVWEDGAPLEAPDGTGGALDAVVRSDWMHDEAVRGREFLFVWYGNDLTAGQAIPDVIAALAERDQSLLWMSDQRGQAALETLRRTANPSGRLDLIEAVEDAPGAYGFRLDRLPGLLDLVSEHVVTKHVPIWTPDGRLAQGIKRERFLADLVCQETLADRRQGTDRTTARGRHAASRAGEFLRGLLGRDRLLGALQAGRTTFTVEGDIGEKRPGEFLVGTYRIVDVEHGALGIVYLCEDERDGERVAVKTYSDQVRWGRPGAVRRFWHEAHTWVTLPEHPNVVSARHVQEIDGRLHIFLDYVDGGDLRSRLRRGLPSTREAIEIALQVCAGLQAMHANGLVHCDIKPENILLTRAGLPKITDLSLVMAAAEGPPVPTGGTPGYAAPEQVLAPERVVPSADLYAFGVVLHEMLTGERPGGVPTPLRHLHHELVDVVARCLDLDPARRPTADAVGQSLASVYRVLTGETFPAASLYPRDPVSLAMGRVASLAALGRHREALEQCEECIRARPNDLVALYTRARLLYDMRRYEECARQCLEMFRLPDEAEPGLRHRLDSLIAMCAIRQGVPQGSAMTWLSAGQIAVWSEGQSGLGLEYADIALTLDPECHTAWHFRAQCLYNLGQYEEALEAYGRAARSPDATLTGLVQGEARRCQAILDGRGLQQFRVQQVVTAGERCVEARRFGDAERHFVEALKRDPDNRQAALGLSMVALELGRPAEALDRLDGLLQAAPESSTLWYHQGLALLLLDRAPEALSCFDRVLAVEPGHFKAWNNRGSCLLAMGQVSEAQQCFAKALSLNPESEIARQGLAECEARTSPATGDDTGAALYWLRQGVDYAERTQWKAAIDCLQTAIGLDPASALAWYNAGYALWMSGFHQAATDHCQRALALDPSLVHAWNILGNALDDLGNTEEALDAFDQALRLDARYYEAWNGRGLCLASLARHDEALTAFARACDILPTFGRAWFNKGTVLDQLGRSVDAVECFDRALAIDANHRGAAAEKGRSLLRQRRYEAAAAAFRQAIATAPHDAGTWNNLGAALLMLGQYADASKHFKRSLELDPHSPEPRRNLERLQQMSGGLLA